MHWASAGVNALRSKGLVVHEAVKILGWEFEQARLRPMRHRIWRVILALRRALQTGFATGRQLEKILGHATFIALGRREVLRVFGETYTFIQRFYNRPHRVWGSVRREMSIWIGVAPLIWRDLTIPWSSEVTAVDASTWGLGATASYDRERVQKLGRFSERWRFDIPHFSKPRATAFGYSTVTDGEDAAALGWAYAAQPGEARPEPLRRSF